MDYFSYRISLYKLNRDRDKAYKALSKSLEEAEKNGSEEVQAVYAAEGHDLLLVEAKFPILITRYLISKAEKMLLPTPPMTEKGGLWDKSLYTYDRYYLTPEGITVMRRLIRKERKERLEIVFPWIVILMGLIGAVTGLIALIRQ